MTFCPRCGAPLTVGHKLPHPTPSRGFSTETRKAKNRRRMSGERRETRERRVRLRRLVNRGFILIVLGLFAIAGTVGFLNEPTRNALMLLIIGVAVIVVAVFLSTRARKRYPPTPKKPPKNSLCSLCSSSVAVLRLPKMRKWFFPAASTISPIS